MINIIWAKAARKVDDMVQDHLADLQNAATEIVGSFRNQTGLRRVSGTENLALFGISAGWASPEVL